MGVINFGINRNLVEEIAQKVKPENFIETGTYLGGTSSWAASHFKEVHTIEISEEIYNKTKVKFAHLKNMHCYLGDSKQILPEIVSKVKGQSLFWLDGHWCGRNTGGKYNECPIFDELNAACKTESPIILIDDLRYFLGPNPYDFGEGYPTLNDILKFLIGNLPDHYVTVHDDTLICVPEACRSIVDADWKNNYQKRFPMSLKSIGSKLLWRVKNLDFKLEKNK